MLLYVGEPYYTLITAVEGTGDNLLPEDIQEGFVDYFMSSIYEQDGEDITLKDSGQILSGTLIKDMEEGEILQRILEYWEMTDATYTILEH